MNCSRAAIIVRSPSWLPLQICMVLHRNRRCACPPRLAAASDGCARRAAPPAACSCWRDWRKGAVDGKDREGKAANYALVQQLAEEFRKRNGSMICAELLGLKKPEGSSTPEARTEQYYAKRPCAKMVEEAAAIWAEYLEKQRK